MGRKAVVVLRQLDDKSPVCVSGVFVIPENITDKTNESIQINWAAARAELHRVEFCAQFLEFKAASWSHEIAPLE